MITGKPVLGDLHRNSPQRSGTTEIIDISEWEPALANSVPKLVAGSSARFVWKAWLDVRTELRQLTL